jgi:hypothetical protein
VRNWKNVKVTGRKTTKRGVVEVGDVRECAVGNFKIIAQPCCRVVLRFDCTKHVGTLLDRSPSRVFIETTGSVLLLDGS